jgi:SAM-dependent methyltransferase
MGRGRAGSYGIDAPYVPFGWLLGAVACGVGAAFGFAWGGPQAGTLPLVISVILLLGAISYFYATRRGKFVLWQGILAGLELSGKEKVLDLGCGRGAVLLLAAGALTTGKAVGIDLWRSMDQSGNAEAVTRHNAEAEGVADRIQLRTGDITELPFKDRSFDVVVSSLAIHNIRGDEGRDKAIEEAVRVLRPGGRLAVMDIQATPRYVAKLTELGLTAQRRPLGWRGWWTGPWMSSSVVTATKQ